MVMTSSPFMSSSLSEADVPQKFPARGEVRENTPGSARVPLLFDGDVSAVADFDEQLPHRSVVDPATAYGAHNSFSTGVEEADAAAHDIGIFRAVDIFEMDVVRA